MSLVRARRLPGLLLICALLSLALASPVAAANNVILFAYFGDCQFFGDNAGSGKTVKIEWRDSDGNLKTKHSVTSNNVGQFTSKCEFGELVENGDVIQTKIGTAARSFTVPKVTANVDRDADTVSGKVNPAPDLLTVDVLTYEGGFSESFGTWHHSEPAPSSGSYTTTSWDSSPDIRGWDDVYAAWSNARGDTFIRYITAEGMRVWVRQQFLEVVGNPKDSVDVKLFESISVNLLATVTGWLNRNGSLEADFLDADGDPIRVKTGNEIDGDFASDAEFVVPALLVTASKATDKVTVDCGLGSGHGIVVQVRTRDLSKDSGRTGFTGAGGTFVANFAAAPTYNIVAGDKVDVFCKLDSGDIVAKTVTVL